MSKVRSAAKHASQSPISYIELFYSPSKTAGSEMQSRAKDANAVSHNKSCSSSAAEDNIRGPTSI